MKEDKNSQYEDIENDYVLAEYVNIRMLIRVRCEIEMIFISKAL